MKSNAAGSVIEEIFSVKSLIKRPPRIPLNKGLSSQSRDFSFMGFVYFEAPVT